MGGEREGSNQERVTLYVCRCVSGAGAFRSGALSCGVRMFWPLLARGLCVGANVTPISLAGKRCFVAQTEHGLVLRGHLMQGAGVVGCPCICRCLSVLCACSPLLVAVHAIANQSCCWW